jgi:hypothetical protein
MFVIRRFSSWTVCGYPYNESAGYVNRAAAIAHGSGYDDKGFFDTTCPYTISTYDCNGVGHTTTVPGDPVQGSYARGNVCTKE